MKSANPVPDCLVVRPKIGYASLEKRRREADMTGLYFLLPTLLVIFLSFLIVRTGAVALMITRMEEKKARFQALSAFSGTVFTTRKAESVVNHPQRRRIVSTLIILGNAGIVTVIVTSTSPLVTSKTPISPLCL
jgi:hypothetical protein